MTDQERTHWMELLRLWMEGSNRREETMAEINAGKLRATFAVADKLSNI